MASRAWIVELLDRTSENGRRILDVASKVRQYRHFPGIFAVSLDDRCWLEFRNSPALRFHPDRRLEPFHYSAEWFRRFKEDSEFKTRGMNDVLELIHAPQAWPASSGEGANIAIV